MSEDKNEKLKKTIVFNASKKETHHPNSGFKKLCRRLKSSYKVTTNKDEITADLKGNLLVFGAPSEELEPTELEEFKRWLAAGGRAMILLGNIADGESGGALHSFLDEYGIKCNQDSVMRTAFYKYLHPKEVFINDGVLVPDILRKKNNALGAAAGGVRKPAAQAKATPASRGTGANATPGEKLGFVYPYGVSLNIQKPARPLLSSGPISYPMNRPIAGVWESETMQGEQRGRLLVIGSVEIFSDEWIDKEENGKLCDILFSWLIGDLEIDLTSDRADSQLWEYTRVPNIEATAQSIKPCLQGMDDLPKDFTKMFNLSLFKFDTSLIPQAVQLFEALGVPHEPLTLIPPQFECPQPRLQPATFPPAMREPAPPALDQFDLDEHFAPQSIRLAQLTNKCTGGDEDLEYFVAESGDILGVTNELPFGERSAKHILFHIFKSIVDWKKQDGGKPDVIEEVPAYSLDSAAGDSLRGNAVPLMHVDLAPMKMESMGRAQLQTLDPTFNLGGRPAIGGSGAAPKAEAKDNGRESKGSKGDAQVMKF